MSAHLRRKRVSEYEPSAAELKEVWNQREIAGMDESLDKMNALLNKFTVEDELSSPEVSPMRNSMMNNRKKKEFRDWSAASVFDDDYNNNNGKKSPPLLQSTQSPFQPYVPNNNKNTNKFQVAEIPQFDRKPKAPSNAKQKNSRTNNDHKNNLDHFSPKQLQRSLNKRIGKDIPEHVLRRAIKDILHRNSRDVTVRSLRLQLQIALGADFTGCDKLISKLMDEINGIRNGTDDNFLKELQALKKARDAQAKKEMMENKHVKQITPQGNTGEMKKNKKEEKEVAPKPIETKLVRGNNNNNNPPASRNVKKIKTSMPDFEMRRKLGLLTNSEKQKIKEHSAILMQSLARMFLSKLEANKRKQLQLLSKRANKVRKNNAAIKIQSHARARLQRRIYIEQQRQMTKQTNASLMLQKLSRGFLERKRFQLNKEKKINAILIFQKLARGYKARMKYTKIQKERIEAIAKIQSHARKRIQQKQYQVVKQSAVIIESNVRAAKQYRQFQSIKQSTKTIQSSFRKYLNRKRIKEAEAKALLKKLKEQQAEKEREEEKERRRRLKELQLQQDKVAAIKIQKIARGKKIRERYSLEKKSIIMLQKNIRGHLSRKQQHALKAKHKNMENVINCINNNAAILLQKHTRGFLERKKVLNEKTVARTNDNPPPGLVTSHRIPIQEVDHINQIKEAGRGVDLPKVRTAGFAHVKRFRDSNKLPQLPVTNNINGNVPVRTPLASAGSNSVSLPNLRSKRGPVNPNWGRGNVKRVGASSVVKQNRIRSLNSRKNIQTKAQIRSNNAKSKLQGRGKKDEAQKPRWGNNFGIRNQYGLYKS